MGERNPIRDRTLILRVLVPGLESRLREKMEERSALADIDEKGSNGPGNVGRNSDNSGLSRGGGGISSIYSSNRVGGGGGSSNDNNNNKEMLLELEGVKCEPVADYDIRNSGGLGDNSEDNFCSIWNFHCDGGIYPARLVNLPCPIELHKTHDHAMYYKCSDVAQMLIVYEDTNAIDEDKTSYLGGKMEGFPSYYPHGLTPPMKNVVQRRFACREHSSVAPPRAHVSHVEKELIELMQKISKDSGGSGGGGGSGVSKRNKVPSLASAQQANKVLEEVLEEVVDYEPWMDRDGQEPSGIEFDSDDPIVNMHPELWLPPEVFKNIIKQHREEEKQAEEAKQRAKEAKEAKKKKPKKSNKKDKKDKKVESFMNAMLDDFGSTKNTKKGIAKKKDIEVVDEVTQAATSMLTSENLMDDVNDDDLFDFDGDEFKFDDMEKLDENLLGL